MRRTASGPILIAALLAAALCGAARADTVALRASVRLPAGTTTVRLADVADLQGPRAEAFAGLVVGERGSDASMLEISLVTIRARLDEAGAHWGQLHLSGNLVVVRPRHFDGAGAPTAMAGAALEEAAAPRSARRQRDELEAVELMARPTLRGAITRLIVQGGGAGAPDRLRLIFDATDRDLLDAVEPEVRYEIEPLGSLRSDRIELAVRAWRDGRADIRHDVTVRQQIRTDTVTLKEDMRRGQMFRESMLEPQVQWLAPSQAALVSNLVEAVGRNAGKSLTAGEVLRRHHVEKELLVERGEVVVVRCLVGGVAITMQAEARTDGVEGDIVELRKHGERTTFTAVVTGRSEVVIDMTKR